MHYINNPPRRIHALKESEIPNNDFYPVNESALGVKYYISKQGKIVRDGVYLSNCLDRVHRKLNVNYIDLITVLDYGKYKCISITKDHLLSFVFRNPDKLSLLDSHVHYLDGDKNNDHLDNMLLVSGICKTFSRIGVKSNLRIRKLRESKLNGYRFNFLEEPIPIDTGTVGEDWIKMHGELYKAIKDYRLHECSFYISETGRLLEMSTGQFVLPKLNNIKMPYHVLTGKDNKPFFAFLPVLLVNAFLNPKNVSLDDIEVGYRNQDSLGFELSNLYLKHILKKHVFQ